MDKLSYKPVSHDHEEFLREAKKDEEFRKEYEALAPAYALIRELLLARQHSGLTQESIAQKIGTTKSAISRLESGGKHIPSITTLRKYAEAVGCELEIKLVPKKQGKSTA
ncbi:MAG: helix-turn-helix transcriptional regulator [Chlorobiaceae bacterium]|jgi:DNA-binding XRE family transcriptional regulator|nr:helix-turn-helix transcriptional regulator [Chlorobiaceae bacterium]